MEPNSPKVIHIGTVPFGADASNYVFIGRPSKWGNPFKIGTGGKRAQVIAKYETWLLEQPELMAALPELKGMNLVCYCAPKPCHGDVLLRLANTQQGEIT